MLLMQIFLPRFLVLEVVLFFHFIQQGHCRRQLRSLDGPEENNDEDDECTLDIVGLGTEYPPLFLHQNGSQLLLPQPKSDEDEAGVVLRVSKFDKLTASCPGSTIRAGSAGSPARSISFDCLPDKKFFRDNVELSDGDVLKELSCSKSIQETLTDLKDSDCGPEGEGWHLVQVGWQIESGEPGVIPQYTVCHSKSKAHTFYSSHILHGRALASNNADGPRPSNFKEGKGFFTTSSPSNAYSLKTQKETFLNLLGQQSSEKFFSAKKYFLAKGHLAPDADFVYQEWQDASYFFFNVAPQWQSFNNGNWKSVESLLRKFSASTKKELNVHTGTFGQLELPNDEGDLVPIALEQRNGLIPVPGLVWKLVHDAATNQAIIFVGVNNPHVNAKEISDRGLILCPNENPDLCSNLGWSFRNRKDVIKGFLYCCTYQSAKASIAWMPDLDDPEPLAFEDPARRTSPRRRPSREDSDSSLCLIDLNPESRLKWPPLFYDSNQTIILPRRVSVPEAVAFDTSDTTLLSNNNADNDTRNVISVDKTDNNVIVACPGNRLKFTGQSRAQFQCINNILISPLTNQEVQYSDLSCTKSIEEDLVASDTSCGPPEDHPGKIARIGWTVGETFKPMISICHSADNEHTHYAFHTINGISLSAREKEWKRKSNFKEGPGFYNRSNAKKLYKLKNQEKVFSAQGLGQFFSRENETFLTRGHLAPNSDFAYKEWQDATFYFLNVAPQWKKFNSGNWLALELKIRAFAQDNEANLEVHTGTHGTLTLPDSSGTLKEVFLDKSHLIPVPLFYWKLVHDPEENLAIAFVGVNSPEIFDTIPSNLLICPDICDSTNWDFPKKDVAEKGFLYCCSYQSLNKALNWINFLDNPGILKY